MNQTKSNTRAQRAGRKDFAGAGRDERGRVLAWGRVLREIDAGVDYFWRKRGGRPHQGRFETIGEGGPGR